MITYSSLSQNDKILAALAHTCVLVPFWGIIGAIGIWITQKEHSRFVGFQALQAVLYQLILILYGVCFGAYTITLTTFLLIPQPGQSGSIDYLSLLIISPCICGGLFLLAYFGYGLWAAISVFRGKDFRYLVIGSQLEKRIGNQGL